MPKCEILETFKGSQDGRFTETFEKGTEVVLSQYLVDCAPKGSIRLVDEVQNKAIITNKKRETK